MKVEKSSSKPPFFAILISIKISAVISKSSKLCVANDFAQDGQKCNVASTRTRHRNTVSFTGLRL